jgi:hypothetical protein
VAFDRAASLVIYKIGNLISNFMILIKSYFCLQFFLGGYKWSLLKVREGKYKGKHGEALAETGSRDSFSVLQVLLKPMMTYGKGRRRFQANQGPGRGMGGSQPGEGSS